MLSLGVGEILVIAVVLVVFVGPERLPHALRWAGRTYGQVRRAADDMRRAFVLEADRQDAEERYRKLKDERQRLREERDAALQAAIEARAAGLEPPDEAAAVPFEEQLPPARQVPVEVATETPE
ncbi:MAG: twin-arginine translocase subunit TatB [Alphaproteobacteria bacterium]|nr:twin-arginine translocase subunit TatB [Alphaproteobacteria bacterium]MCB9690378.1 twin-arginine translocase subunit TatB [Alphaproteobacteria bacterium]